MRLSGAREMPGRLFVLRHGKGRIRGRRAVQMSLIVDEELNLWCILS